MTGRATVWTAEHCVCVCVCVCARVYHISDLLLLFFLIFRYELIKLGFCLSSGFNPSCFSLEWCACVVHCVYALCVCMHTYYVNCDYYVLLLGNLSREAMKRKLNYIA